MLGGLYTHIETCVHVCAYLYMNILTVSQIHNTYSKGTQSDIYDHIDKIHVLLCRHYTK